MKKHGVQMRSEQEIFDDLADLCASPGYVHAIAYLCFRSNMVPYDDEINAEHMEELFPRERLLRTEISTLIGLMLKHDIDYSMPVPKNIELYVKTTEELLAEIHATMSAPLWAQLDPDKIPDKIPDKSVNPFTSGSVLREAIFYGGESAYSFQYRDFSPKKYGRDDTWLLANKGFSIQEARDVVYAIGRLRNEKAVSVLNLMRETPPDSWTLLPANTFTLQDVVDISQIDSSTVERVLAAFSVSIDAYNNQFCSLNDFNLINAYPIIPISKHCYILFDIYSLVEALYETPFYWMIVDKNYIDTAMTNRGMFTEEFAAERLSRVFGKSNVFSNINIFDSTGNILGEIDVLVIFANRALVLQAKSKRLTLEARSGNDRQIKDDFKKSIQDSNDQAHRCALLLEQGCYFFKDITGASIQLPTNFKRIYIICLIADHYPALSFQARQFLNYVSTATISPPFVMDVFALDAMTEMLDSPLQMLSYIDRRTNYSDKLMAMYELTILSCHLKQNLWLSNEFDMVLLDDDISVDLDLAMLVRREGVPGRGTPDGILTRFASTALGRMVKTIEAKPEPATLDLGFTLLTLGEEAVGFISEAIDQISQGAITDGKNHDFTGSFGEVGTGLTIHCNNDPIVVAGPRLEHHCQARKYTERAKSWFGVCIRPNDQALRFGINLEFPWEHNDAMDLLTKDMSKSTQISPLLLRPGSRTEKVGRNAPCPCGSGKKYKKCCLSRPA